MTDTPEQDPPLTAEQETAVRRALARAGGPEPMPGDVADRLDQVITDLAAERSGAAATVADPAAPHGAESRVVVPLDAAARRRRTRVRALLAAAAVVVAGGVAAGIVTGEQGGDSDLATTSTAERPARGEEDAGGASAADGGDAGDQLLDAESAPAEDAPLAGAVVPGRRVVTEEPLRTVRADHLRADLTALQATLPDPARADYAKATLRAPREFVCPGAALGRGYLVGVEYGAKPALVAFREPVGSSQVAEVLACGTGDVLHSTTLAAP